MRMSRCQTLRIAVVGAVHTNTEMVAVDVRVRFLVRTWLQSQTQVQVTPVHHTRHYTHQRLRGEIDLQVYVIVATNDLASR